MGIYQLKYGGGPEVLEPFVRHLGKDVAENRVRLTWPFPHAKKLTEQEFWHPIGIHAPYSLLYAGHVDIGEATASVMFFASGGGPDYLFAVVRFFSGREGVEYYRVSACEHEYQSASGGRCYTIYTCKHCGHRYDIDSSD